MRIVVKYRTRFSAAEKVILIKVAITTANHILDILSVETGIDKHDLTVIDWHAFTVGEVI